MALIVIVDDDDITRTLLGGPLAGLGHTVLEASNGMECLAHIKSARPDLVITDIFMPEMDGVELVRKIGALRLGIKILAMSSGQTRHGAMDFLDTVRGLGADQIFSKPINIKHVLQMVEDLLLAPTA